MERGYNLFLDGKLLEGCNEGVTQAFSCAEWKGKSLSRVWLFVTPWIYSPWNSPGQNTRGGSLSPLQGIFPTQGSNPDLPHCRQILYQLSHKESPWILEWVAYPFSSKSSRPRNRTRVSCIVGGFFPNWAIRWALFNYNAFKYFFQALYLLEYL